MPLPLSRGSGTAAADAIRNRFRRAPIASAARPRVIAPLAARCHTRCAGPPRRRGWPDASPLVERLRSLFYEEGPLFLLSSIDVAARSRTPATTVEFHLGRTPGNKGMSYPPDPPRVEEIVSVVRQAGSGLHGDRARGLIVVLWRAGLRISEALGLREVDLEPARGALLVREGKGRRRCEVGMDDWGWERLRPWLERRSSMPIGPLFCVIGGPTRGRPWAPPAVRIQLRRLAAEACGAASPRISSATRTRVRWPVKACRST